MITEYDELYAKYLGGRSIAGIELEESKKEGIEDLKNLPESVRCFVFTRDINNPNSCIMTFDGQFYWNSEKSCIAVNVIEIWERSSYSAALNMENHYELTKRLVELRASEHNDVFITATEENSNSRVLQYEILAFEAMTVHSAYLKALSVDNWISKVTDKLYKSVGQLYVNALTSVTKENLISFPDLIKKVDSERDNNLKGRYLEELIAKFFDEIEGFEIINRIRTKTEEIDITILNKSEDKLWSKESPLILVECKNWTGKCGKNELVLFAEKLYNRRGRAKVGFFVSWNGFKGTFILENLRSTKDDTLIIPVDGQQIRDAITNNNISEALSSLWMKSVNL